MVQVVRVKTIRITHPPTILSLINFVRNSCSERLSGEYLLQSAYL